MSSGNSMLAAGAPVPAAGMALRAAGSLTVYRRTLGDLIGRRFLQFLSAVESARWDSTGAPYFRFLHSLLEAREGMASPTGNLWRDHLLERIFFDDNPFTRTAERVGADGMPSVLAEAAAHDLRQLQQLFSLDPTALMVAQRQARRGDNEWPIPGMTTVRASVGFAGPSLWSRLQESDDWGGLWPDLARHYHRQGAGMFGRYYAFRWVREGGHGRLEGVPRPDPIRLEHLIGYHKEREPVVRNTEKFVAGLPANNVLLYGERGTGKSATVKALLNAFAPRRLRLVEVSRHDFGDLPTVMKILAGRHLRFIVFIDDLSFEEGETSYKDLKALLEGSVSARPSNVLVYATSNRRHLVRERFSDRQDGSGDELRRQDTVQEKLSLADRFGMTVVFSGPDQEGYLQIVEGLAAREGISLPQDELRQRALRWTLWQNDRSPRTARQFIDDLKGELALGGAGGGGAGIGVAAATDAVPS